MPARFGREVAIFSIKTILAPTELSDFSLAGVRYALQMANALDARVHVHCVANYEEAMPCNFALDEGASLYMPSIDIQTFLEERNRALTRFLSASCADLISGLSVYQSTDIGAACEKILAKADGIEADLIVMSTHGRTGLGHMLIGSITEQVIRQARCPVLSICPQHCT